MIGGAPIVSTVRLSLHLNVQKTKTWFETACFFVLFFVPQDSPKLLTDLRQLNSIAMIYNKHWDFLPIHHAIKIRNGMGNVWSNYYCIISTCHLNGHVMMEILRCKQYNGFEETIQQTDHRIHVVGLIDTLHPHQYTPDRRTLLSSCRGGGALEHVSIKHGNWLFGPV
jgi:hypothetical protein